MKEKKIKLQNRKIAGNWNKKGEIHTLNINSNFVKFRGFIFIFIVYKSNKTKYPTISL